MGPSSKGGRDGERDMKDRIKPLILLLGIWSFLLAACGGAQEPTKGEVIVYVAAPLSGFQANAGQTVLGGARLAADQINGAGGLLGYKVTIVGLDDESDSDVAVDIAAEVRPPEPGHQVARSDLLLH